MNNILSLQRFSVLICIIYKSFERRSEKFKLKTLHNWRSSQDNKPLFCTGTMMSVLPMP